MAKSKSGFTIVELLIVIVVIGILAAITIVAYSGIQERARIVSGLSFERQLVSKYSATATGFWSFDDCAGATASNAGSSSSVDAIIPSAPTWITDTPSKTGCALKLNGSTRIETQATLSATNYVKAAWVRMSTGTCSGSQNIVSQAAASGGVEAAFYMPSCKPAAGHNGLWNTVIAPQAINDGKWHHLAVIWENNILTLYVDGKSVSKADVSTLTNATNGTVSIGAHIGGNFMTGDIDNVLVATQ